MLLKSQSVKSIAPTDHLLTYLSITLWARFQHVLPAALRGARGQSGETEKKDDFPSQESDAEENLASYKQVLGLDLEADSRRD